MAENLLIIEDEALLGSELSRHFRRGGWDVTLAKSLAEARAELLDRGLEPLVVLSDMSLPDGSALDLLEELQTGGTGGWIFLTGYGSVPDSVRALRLGAVDFLEKPCDLERLDVVVAGASRGARAERRLHDHVDDQSRLYTQDSFIGRAAATAEVREMLAKLSVVSISTMILTGESGTGKGLAARILHHGGTRGDGPLIEINCAALPRELLESELFGHEAGAFTGAKVRRRGLLEKADGGTLFLDEIGDMPVDLQTKLLKAIEDQTFRRLGGDREIKVDIQFLAASNADLRKLVDMGDFRGDLYHRLSVFRLDLPSLRDRIEDVEDLVPVFTAEFNSKAGKRVTTIPDEAWSLLEAHDWPGNVRELRNAVERCVLLSEGEVFPVQWLQLAPAGGMPGGPEVTGKRLSLPLDGSMALEEMDRYIIKTALERHDRNVTAAARALGTTRETLRYRIKKYGL